MLELSYDFQTRYFVIIVFFLNFARHLLDVIKECKFIIYFPIIKFITANDHHETLFSVVFLQLITLLLFFIITYNL